MLEEMDFYALKMYLGIASLTRGWLSVCLSIYLSPDERYKGCFLMEGKGGPDKETPKGSPAQMLTSMFTEIFPYAWAVLPQVYLPPCPPTKVLGQERR